MTTPPAPVTMQDVVDATTWDEALDISVRGIEEIRSLKAALPGLHDAERAARDTLQAAEDRRAELQQIMNALIAKGPELA